MTVNSSTMAGAQVALSILTRGGGGGNAKVVAPVAKAESPAVIIDPRIEALVGKQAEAASGEGGGEGDTVAVRREQFWWMQEMVQNAERDAVNSQQTIETSKTIVKIYEETGKLYQPANGGLAEYIPKEGWKPGQIEEIINGTRKSIGYGEKAMPSVIEGVKNMRANYESIIAGTYVPNM